MTDTLEKIQQEEFKLENDLDKTENEERQVKQIEEEYEEFFSRTSSLFNEMDEQFQQNDFSWKLSTHSENVHQRRGIIFNELASEQQQLHKQKTSIEDKQNDLFYQRKRLLANEEGQTNEH